MDLSRSGPGRCCNLWLLSDRWPDTRTFASMAEGVFRLFGAETEHEKALAVFDWIRLSMRRGTAVKEGPPGAATYCPEPGRTFHVHGHHYCDGLGRLMVNMWRATGRPARKIVMKRLGHTLAELWYVDGDGVGRWHVFDPQKGWYVYDRTGKRIAGFAEIAADHTLMTQPSRTSEPYFYHPRERDMELADMETWCHGWVVSVTPEAHYSPHLDLLPGQQWEIFYRPEGPGFPGCTGSAEGTWDARSDLTEDGSPRTPAVWPWRKPYLVETPAGAAKNAGKPAMPHGTARLTWEVPLDPALLQGPCGASVIGRIACTEHAGERLLHPARSAELAQVVVPIRLPYLLTRLQVEARTKRTGDALNHVILFGSRNGRDFQGLTQGFWGKASLPGADEAGGIRLEFGPESYARAGKLRLRRMDADRRLRDLSADRPVQHRAARGGRPVQLEDRRGLRNELFQPLHAATGREPPAPGRHGRGGRRRSGCYTSVE